MIFKFTGRGPHRLPDGRVLNTGDTFEDTVDWSLKRDYVRAEAPAAPSPARVAPPSPPAATEVAAPAPASVAPISPAAAEEEGGARTWPRPDDLRELAFAEALAIFRDATGKTARSWDALIEEYRSWHTAQPPDEGGL